MAERRAAHQLLDKPLVFDDPLAVRIIGARAEANLPEQPKNFVAARFRAFMAARSRFAEDELRAAVARGVRQYVVLGAGLDTFAYRNPFPHLRVFEVDHPATQAWKRKRLAQVGIPVPSSMTFAPVDFERQTFDDGLREAGFDETAPTFFSWLGVTMYLESDIVLGIVRAIREMSATNGVVFDYAVPRESLGFVGRLALQFMKQYEDAGLKGKVPLLGGGTTTDESVLPQMGDEAIGAITPLHYSAAIDTPQNKKFAAAFEAKAGKSSSYYSEATYTGTRWIVEDIKAVGGKVEDRDALLSALRKVDLKDAPRGPISVDQWNNPVQTIYIRKVEKVGGKLQNTVIATFPAVGQFYKYNPEEYMKTPLYSRDYPPCKHC